MRLTVLVFVSRAFRPWLVGSVPAMIKTPSKRFKDSLVLMSGRYCEKLRGIVTRYYCSHLPDTALPGSGHPLMRLYVYTFLRTILL